MSLLVKLSASLRGYFPEYDQHLGLKMDLPPGGTVREVLVHLNLAPELVKIIMVNGRHAQLDDQVADGDRLGFFPAVGGG